MGTLGTIIKYRLFPRVRPHAAGYKNEEVFTMITTYEDYLALPMSLSFGEMADLHRQIVEEAGQDADALALYNGLLAAAVKYSGSRANWPLWDREEKTAEDAARTSSHNQVIDRVNILARYLRKQGKAAVWREVLGDEKKDPGYRKRTGDFACYLVFVEGLNAR